MTTDACMICTSFIYRTFNWPSSLDDICGDALSPLNTIPGFFHLLA